MSRPFLRFGWLVLALCLWGGTLQAQAVPETPSGSKKEAKAAKKKEKPEKKKKKKKSSQKQEKGGGEETKPTSPNSGPTPPPKKETQTSLPRTYYVPCARFRTGVMRFTDPAYGGIKIIRKKKKEIHINQNTGNKMVFKIVWVGDCQYDLTFKKSKEPVKYRKGWVIHMDMVTSFPSYYDFENDVNGVKGYGWIEKPETKAELKAKAAREKRVADSIETERQHFVEDSTLIAEGKEPKWKKPEPPKGAKPSAATPQPTPDPEADDEAANPKKKGKKKKKTSESDPAAQPSKEKKPKEKKEKAPKVKKEKPPKEKKKKEPKEKKGKNS